MQGQWIGRYTPSEQDFDHNFDNMVDPEIFFEWLTGYDDQLKSEVATWLWLHHIESDFCSHSRNLCNHDLVNQVAATLSPGQKTQFRVLENNQMNEQPCELTVQPAVSEHTPSDQLPLAFE